MPESTEKKLALTSSPQHFEEAPPKNSRSIVVADKVEMSKNKFKIANIT